MKFASLTVALLVATVTHALAAKTPVLAPVDFTACMNTSADYGQPRGTSVGNSDTNFSRLAFTLADPSAGNNFWRGEAEGNNLTIKLSVNAPNAIYTMLNTWWGQADVSNAVVTLRFASGRHKRFNLIGNDRIRDYNDFDFTDTINGRTAQQWWVSDDGNSRLDVQILKLGNDFVGDRLTKVIVSAPSGTGANAMQPILFAIGIDAGGLTSVKTRCSAK